MKKIVEQGQCTISEILFERYVTAKCSKKLGVQKARSFIRFLRKNGWAFSEIYQLGKYNPLTYKQTDQLIDLHQQLTNAGLTVSLVKRILISRLLPEMPDVPRIVRAVEYYKSKYGLNNERLLELSRGKPRILLLYPDQIDECWNASVTNGTRFAYYLRKRTTASAQCPDIKSSFPRHRRSKAEPHPSLH